MAKVSIIIPVRAETEYNVNKTVDNIYENAIGDFEVLVGYDGPHFWSLKDHPNLRYLCADGVIGIKPMINALAAMATGKYIYKSDAHCSFGKGFDEILQADMEDNWIVMPRFYVLNGETWEWQDERFYDYFYLSCPFTDPKGFRFKAGGHWPERTQERLDTLIDETPQIHGSGWFMTKDRYFELGGFPNIDPYGHAQEPLWLALRNWIEGGKVMVNKKTWYAHLHQDGNKRGYLEDKAHTERTYNETAIHFVKDKGNYLHSFEWFVDKFMPMPTWNPDWKEDRKWLLSQ